MSDNNSSDITAYRRALIIAVRHMTKEQRKELLNTSLSDYDKFHNVFGAMMGAVVAANFNLTIEA